MTQNFVDRICDAATYGKYLHHGKYAYSIEWDATGGFWYVARCPVGYETYIFIDPDGLQCGYWEPVQRLKATKNGVAIDTD